MQYDPIKRRLGTFFNRRPWMRVLFYRLLDLLLLRTWHVHKAIRQWAKPYPGEARILDAGSGFGQYTFYLSSLSKKYEVMAVDVKEEQIDDCRQFFKKIGRDGVKFSKEDLTAYSLPDAFQLIISIDVMEHILEDEKVFANFYNSLAAGGMLLVSTPSDQGGSDVHDHEHESFIDEHVRDGYNIEEIRGKLNKAGFQRVEASYVYGKPGKISWKLSMKYPILLLNASYLFIILLPFYYFLTYPLAYLLNHLDLRLHHKSGSGLIVKAYK